MLPSFEITNFRTFSHLRIERLGRVNLVVGRNNVGKTCLLEALRLFASDWPPSSIQSILHERNEFTVFSGTEKVLPVFESLFHGRQISDTSKITLGSPDMPECTCTITTYPDTETAEERGPAGPAILLAIDSCDRQFNMHADRSVSYTIRRGSPRFPGGPPYLPADRLPEDVVAEWWDDVSLTDAEERIIRSLELMLPIERVTFVDVGRQNRVAKVRVAGSGQPVSMRSLGDGVVRMFQIALALEYAAARKKPAHEKKTTLDKLPDFLLIDEIENGIHYSLHADLWKSIFHLARSRNVQVFATTHSWDCIEGFQKALAADKDADGLVIRLERKEDIDKARAVIIDQEDLPIVTRESIEVR